MKQQWLKLAARIDMLTLRQRLGLFGAAVAALLFALYALALEPLMREQARLRAQINAQQKSMRTMDADITARAEAFAVDPDQASRTRLAAARAQTEALSRSLSALQKGLVAPVLESILRANGRLRLVSLATLPVSSVGDATPAPSSAPAVADTPATPATVLARAVAPAPPAPAQAAPKATGVLYRHGVQVTVRGNYLDMIDYMASLEGLPTQLFWGQAQLEVQEYPNANLSLTLYTLSLDSKWMKL